MAAINKLRKHSALVMILVGGALLAFILSDLGRGTQRQSKYMNVGVVDGEKISSTDFNNEVDRVTNIRSLNSDPKTVAEMSYSIRESVWNDMVKDALLNREYDKLGINVTKEEMNDMIRGSHPHVYVQSFPPFLDPATQKVDVKRVDQFLTNLSNPQVVPQEARDYYLYMEEMIRKETEESKYNNLFTKGYYVPKAFAEKDYLEKNTNYDVYVVARRYKDIPDSSFTASKGELQSYYNKHKKEYKTTESRNIAYVDYDIKPTVQDRNNIISDVNKLYEEFKTIDNISSFFATESDLPLDTTWKKAEDLSATISNYVFENEEGTFITPYNEGEVMYFAKILKKDNRPDSLKASHILIAYKGAYGSEATVTRTKEQAKATADSLQNVVRQNITPFTVLADRFSDDGSKSQNHGDLGWFTDGTMVPEFNEYVVDNKIGSVGVVETVFGYHVIKVDDKTAAKPKAQVALFSRPIVPSNETYQQSYMNFSAFAANCKTFDDLMLAASDSNYNVKYFDNATRMAQGLNNIPNSREIIRWAFEDGVEKDEVSSVFDLTDKLVVACVTEIHPEGYLSLADVTSRITPLVLRDKKAAKAQEDLTNMMQGVSSIQQIASKLHTAVDTILINGNSTTISRFGMEPMVAGYMFAAPENKIEGPVNGEQASYVFVKVLKNKADAKADYKSDQQRLANISSGRLTRMAVSTMKEDTKVEDNRYLYY